MMTDRELLEVAARAAGITLEWDGPECHWVPMFYHGKTYHDWNPLENDADAFRLMVDLGIQIHAEGDEDSECVWANDVMIWADGPLLAATRRAVVLAAAEIGKEREK